MAQRDIRVLQTEIGTRGRLAQLERWNVKVLALSAPSADPFLEARFPLAHTVAPRGGAARAERVAPRGEGERDARVVRAAAPAPGPNPQLAADRRADAQAGEGLSA